MCYCTVSPSRLPFQLEPEGDLLDQMDQERPRVKRSEGVTSLIEDDRIYFFPRAHLKEFQSKDGVYIQYIFISTVLI